jgi:ribosomal protein L34E
MPSEPFERRSLLAAMAFANLLLLFGLLMGAKATFMPGGLSLAHDGEAFRRQAVQKSGASDLCSACHVPFRGVTDERCLRCHPDQRLLIPAHRPDHMEKVKAQEVWRPLKALECADCHTEHLGKNFRPQKVADERCTTCHPISGETADALRMRRAHFAGKSKGKLSDCVACHVQHGDFALPKKSPKAGR